MLNPLVAESNLETVQNATEALGALMILLAEKDSNLCRLMSPIQSALEHAADAHREAANTVPYLGEVNIDIKTVGFGNLPQAANSLAAESVS